MIASVATPVESKAELPMTLVPERKLTVPVGVAGPVQRITEINVTCWSLFGLDAAVSVTLVARSCTVSVRGVEAAEKSMLSPE